MNSIHLVVKEDHSNQPKLFDEGRYITEGWVMDRKYYGSLFDAKVYLHRSKQENSFIGGNIVGVVDSKPSASNQNRCMIIFQVVDGVVDSPKTGWRNEQCRVN